MKIGIALASLAVCAGLAAADGPEPSGPGPFAEQEIRQIVAAIIILRRMFHSFPMESSGKPVS